MNPLAVLKAAEKKLEIPPEKMDRRASVKKRHSLLKVTSLVDNMRGEPPRFVLVTPTRGVPVIVVIPSVVEQGPQESQLFALAKPEWIRVPDRIWIQIQLKIIKWNTKVNQS